MSAIIDEKGASQVWPGSITQESLSPNVAGNGPLFKVWCNGAQTGILNITNTKVVFNTEYDDTAGCFDASTYRFTPNIAGFYLILASATANLTSATATFRLILKTQAGDIRFGSNAEGSANNNTIASVQDLIYFNGTTDWVECWCFGDTGATFNLIGDFPARNSFQGFLARSAT